LNISTFQHFNSRTIQSNPASTSQKSVAEYLPLHSIIPVVLLALLSNTKRGRVQVKFGPDSRHRGQSETVRCPFTFHLSPLTSPQDSSNKTITPSTFNRTTNSSIDTRPSTIKHSKAQVWWASVHHLEPVDCVAGSRPIGGLPSRNRCMGFIASSTRKAQ
jgi:hypothetical protein